MRPLLSSFALLALTGCGAVLPPAALTPELREAPPPFRALYRLEGSRSSGLWLLVAHGTTGTLVEVGGGPGGVALSLWWTEEGMFQRREGGCVGRNGAAKVPPLADERLTLPREVLVALLAGRVPAEGREVAVGRWLSQWGSATLEVRVAGHPARWVSARLTAPGLENPLRLEVRKHHGRVPGSLLVESDPDRWSLTLLEFRPGQETKAPPWLSLPPCVGP
ncbi:MAG: hypothetical protein RMI39_06600 [Thermoanaerobaculum sp.]|nr:hypothetical protein [Thermoanaerobaculum sp.]